MIYLLSQMTFALIVAIILGAAIGWIICSTRGRQQEQQLKVAIARRNSQLARAQSDIKMLNDDYDEMHRKAQDEIDALTEQNRQLPSLTSNLEKSQLLVSQMMQRHEAKVRDLTTENKALASRLAKLEKQPQTQSSADSQQKPAHEPLHKRPEHQQPANQQPAHQQPARQRPALRAVENQRVDTPEPVRFVAAESPDDPFDQVMDLDADLDGSLTQHTLENDIDQGDLSQADLSQADLSQGFEFDARDGEMLDGSDGGSDKAILFEPVGQHDDLQQIFGIGPLTEKALNDLGITSYSQLAELKQHEIQRIADALQIGPGRIERDNWVGNARRQLEEVLDQL